MDVIFSRSLTYIFVSYCMLLKRIVMTRENITPKAADIIGTLSHPLAAEHPA